MTGHVSGYLDLLDSQREAIFERMGDMPEHVLWYRPGPKVWSIGEHLDHTRVINRFTRRLMAIYSPLAWPFARPFRSRPYRHEIDNVYRRPRFPMNVGWIWSPKHTPEHPIGVRALRDELCDEHDALRGFYESHDERTLGHTLLPDPVIGVLNLVQWLRVQGYHDAHHFERIGVRLDDPGYAEKATG